MFCQRLCAQSLSHLRSGACLAGLAWIAPAGAAHGVEIGFLDCMTRPAREGASVLQASGRIEGARGEWEPLQVVLRGTGEELRGMSMEVVEPEGPGGQKLPAGKLFRGDYVKVVRATEYSPLGPGDYVDPLVPLTGGKPLVGPGAPNELISQPIWVDFQIPESALPGSYRGELVVRGVTGEERGRKPFEVHVWDFVLPGMPSLKSSIGMDPRRVAKIHGLPQGTFPFNRMCRQYEDLLADHRLAAEMFWGSLEAYDGDAGKASLDHAGMPGLGTPREVYRHFFAEKQLRNGGLAFWPEWPLPEGMGADRETALRMLAQLMREFEKEGWADRIAVNCGSVDEPDSREDYEEVRRHGEFFNELEKRFGVRLPMCVTEQPSPESRWWGSLHGYVDIYVTHVSDLWDDMHGRKTRAVQERLKAGDEVWMYPAMVQVPGGWLRSHGMPKVLAEGNPPAWILDFPPMNHRVFAWAAVHYGITGILYWDTVEWRDGIDPWERADTLEVEGGAFNGDGLLIYPGYRDRLGFEGPVPSVRLKWIREAMEDHGYWALLQERGEGDWALEQIRKVCRGIGDWDGAPEKWFAVRRVLAERLERKN